MKDYSNYYPSRRDRRKHKTTQNFLIHNRESNEGCLVYVNGDKNYRLPVIIKDHTNPINEYLEDKKMYFLNDYEDKSIVWGDEVTIEGSEKYEDGDYLIITRPDTDGYESKCRIRKMYNDAKFKIDDVELNYKCIMADGLLYNASAYVNDVNVFTEEDLRAILIRYDKNTSKIKLFDNILVDGLMYKVSKIDNYTLKKYNEEFGVIQMAIIRTIFGELSVNGKPFIGITRYARLKEQVYNSKARQVLSYHNVIKSGDYIAHKYLRDEDGNYETRIYIVKSLVDVKNEYDTCFAVNCDAEFNMRRIKDFDLGESIMIPAYFEDNRTQQLVNERNANAFVENSKYQCLVQNNAHTRQLGKEVSRIIVRDEAYRIVGTDKLCLEGAIYVGLMDSKKNPSTDNIELGIADYYKTDSREINIDIDEEIVGEDKILFGDSGVYRLREDIDYRDSKWDIQGDGCTIFSVVENQCLIEVEDKSLLIGKKIRLQVEISSGEKYVKDIEIIGW